MPKSFKTYENEMTHRHCAFFFFVLVFTVSTIGCAEINHLREAQDAFNQAAYAENALRFNPVPNSEAASLSAAARTGYASVLISLDRLDSQEIGRLKEDKLWGNVLALKAIRWFGSDSSVTASSGPPPDIPPKA